MMWVSVESGGAVRAAPCARAKHSATLLDGKVYVLGGRGAGGSVPLRDFWRYCLATSKWEKLEARGEPPPALQEHTATSHGSKIYVFGGEAGALSNETPLWIYDTETQIWRKLPGQSGFTTQRRAPRDARVAACGPRGRRGHSAHALKDCLLIYGGYKDLRGSTNELWAFHYESESWQAVRTAGPGPARHRHAAAVHAGRLYVHGGQCDLRDCADLWHYDTLTRVWASVRASKAGPGARSGHAGLRAGAHFYIFGGEAHGHPTNELWRFHFATETWERIIQSVKWPSARVDGRALLVGGAGGAAGGAAPPVASAPPAAPAGFLREISRLPGLRLRRAARCSYTALAERDSTESLLCKSRSAQLIDAGDAPRDLAREPISVPDFADMVLPTPVLSPTQATRLVYFDSDEEEDMRREIERAGRARVCISKSASVRFTRAPSALGTAGPTRVAAADDDAELSTSDYASAERVGGFSNPHYLGPDVRALGAALTPDSGVAPGDIELQELGERRARSPRRLHLLLVGGKEPPHLALLQSPLSMWSYRLL